MSIQPTSNSEGSSTVQVSTYLEEADFPKYFLVKYLCPLAKQDAPLNGVSVPGWKGGMLAMGVPSPVHDAVLMGQKSRAQGTFR